MKLVIIIPPSPWLMSDRDQPMMGVLYVTAYVKSKGYDTQVCDLAGIPEEHWHIPVGDIYGVTGTTPNFPYMKRIIDILKRREPHKKVVVGGVHASVLPYHILDQTKADICVIGEGEQAMVDILEGRSNGNIVRGSRFVNLDHAPFPDRKSIDYFDYLKPQTYKYLADVREASIITGRGCPFKCCYCIGNKLYDGYVRFRSPQNVFLELANLKEEYNIGMCNFVDDTFILNKTRVKNICDSIKSLGIKWFCLTRTDLVDYDLFVEMRDAGCLSITFGFESGSNKVLKAIKKNTTVEQAYEAIKITKKAGLRIRGQLMVGLPSEDDIDVEATARFIRNSPQVDTFGLHVFQPYPGCDVWENPDNYKWEIDKNTDFSDFHTIGKPGERLTSDDRIWDKYLYLKNVIGSRSIDNQ